MLFSFFSLESGWLEIKLIIGCTAKSVTKLLKLIFPGAIYGVAFLQVPADSYSDVTFSCKNKDVVTKVVATFLTMAESEEIVPSVSAASSNLFLAVSTPLESAASSSNVPVVSSRSEMLSKLCFTNLLPVHTITHRMHVMSL